MTMVDLGRFYMQFKNLEQANLALAQRVSSIVPSHQHQQPIHVVYGGAHMFSATTIEKIGRLALGSFDEFVNDAQSLSNILEEHWDEEFAAKIYSLVQTKLQKQPIEDYRIDFEDGYGVRSDEEEDQHARNAAEAVVDAVKSGKLNSRIGIRIKPLSNSGFKRSIRTLVTFFEAFCKAGGSEIPLHHLTVTLPKVSCAGQVEALVDILERLQFEAKFPKDFFLLELLIETPEAFLSLDGRIPLPSFIEAARGRCTSLHFGIYDFTSSLGIGSAGQSIDHITCDFARIWMQVAAGLVPGIGLSDGIINILPIPKYRNKDQSVDQQLENRVGLEEAWRYNYQKMLQSLANGFYQGWDLHPSQVPIRHIANHVYVLRELPNAIKRMAGFLSRSAQANRVGTLFDDRASVLGLINFAERGIAANILSREDFSLKGIDIDQLKAMI